MNFNTMKNMTILTGLALSLVLAACSGNQKSDSASTEQIISVKGELVTAVSRQLTKTFTGSLEGVKQAVIRAKIAEAVEKIHAREGEYVRTNDPVVSLDRSGPTSSYMQAYSVYQNAEKNFNKMKYLYDQGAVSESQFDGARTEYEVSRANYEAALQMVDLKSPISGTVTSVDVSVGEYVSPGMQVATVASIERMRMKLGISNADIGFFREGQDVKVTVEGDSTLVGEGKVVNVARSADPVTRAFQAEIEIANERHLFKPGMFAKAELVTAKYDNIVAAPGPAILGLEGKNFVFVYSNGKAVYREILMGVEFDGYTEIKSGLNVGDTLITIGQNYVRDGDKVKLARFVGADGKEVEL
ncbi:MAG: efflux RND transporter periplasmic adaptor subunit [candidate division Zixibacteria bacterium]|nr:efflux RND transporter periplasmic adaptor subunit [candidate division Zixibacteria bacterium]